MSQGRLLYSVRAGSNQNQFMDSADPAVRKVIHDHVQGLVTYTPYFDAKLAWMPRAYAYVDAYALYVATDTATLAAHPEWVLKSATGKPLYIPWGAKPLPQYAGDFSNAGFRAYIIAKAQAIADAGYLGVFVDDVNLLVRSTDGTTDATGAFVAVLPTGWTETLWAENMSEFMQLLRTSLPPDMRIIHNAIWYAPMSSAVRNQIASANTIFLERGASDGGITGGTGQYSLSAFMKYIDTVHSLDASVWFDEMSQATLENSIAVYMLTHDEDDQIGFEDLPLAAPWPKLLTVDLGAATGPRTTANGLWQRLFVHGAVYRNEPGANPVTVTLPNASVTLGPGQGKVVLFQ